MPPPPPPPTPPPFAFPPPQQPQPNWWQRNWKWFLPTGCFASLVLLVAFVSLIMLTVFGAMKSSDAYKTAVARASSDPRVTQALGTPIQTGMFLTGSVNTSGGSGNADLAIPISGPKDNGKISATATTSEGQWRYSTLSPWKLRKPANGSNSASREMSVMLCPETERK